MGSQLTKAEKLIAAITVVVILVFIGLFTLVNRHAKSDGVNFAIETGINYKMARPDQAYSEYTLEGRELDQVYEGLPEAEKKALIKRKAELVAKKKEETKKEEAKKKTAATKAKEQAKTQAQQKAKAQEQSKIAQAQQDLMNKRAQATNATSDNSNNSQAYNNNNDNSADAGNDPAQTKAKKSYADWRAQIFASQSSDAIGQFILAYRKNDVTSTELQAMATDLLDQDDAKLKGLGLMLLRSVPSLASLSQLVHAESTLPATYQAYVEQSFIAYFYPQNLSYMNAALQTSDHVLLAKVISLLQTKLEALSKGDQTVFSNGRNSRSNDSGTTTITMSSFTTLIPTLTALGATPNSDLSSAAQQLVSLIQTQNNVAQN
ncbi:MAG: hypothetical protein ACXWPX_12210 [Pseudobdellovibrio sp.]